jgi:pyruvate formate lyase activating enzyme
MNNTASANGLRGLIFDVQAHSVHDGPGTRTTVFMNGCPMCCSWCSNPEGLHRRPVIMWRETKCQRCGACIKACPHGGIIIADDGRTLIHDRKLCNQCESFACVDACFYEGLSITGRYYTVDELMHIFSRDRQFWGSRGGVTFSGGEPLLQKDFVGAILKRCKQEYIHTTVETTACLPTDYFLNICRYVDWAFIDLKHMDPVKHHALTGVSNELILKNIRILAQDPDWDGFLINRMPVIPGINDSVDNIKATARFIKECDLEAINILPFHRLGESKYRQLDREYVFAEQESPSDEYMKKVKKLFEEEGVVCFVGYETPF